MIENHHKLVNLNWNWASIVINDTISLTDFESDWIRTTKLLESKFGSSTIQFVGPNHLNLHSAIEKAFRPTCMGKQKCAVKCSIVKC